MHQLQENWPCSTVIKAALYLVAFNSRADWCITGYLRQRRNSVGNMIVYNLVSLIGTRLLM